MTKSKFGFKVMYRDGEPLYAPTDLRLDLTGNWNTAIDPVSREPVKKPIICYSGIHVWNTLKDAFFDLAWTWTGRLFLFEIKEKIGTSEDGEKSAGLKGRAVFEFDIEKYEPLYQLLEESVERVLKMHKDLSSQLQKAISEGKLLIK